MSRSDLLSDFQQFVTPEQWNEFVRHAQSTCIEKKRLLFWQEKLWANFTVNHVEAPQKFEEIIDLFSRARTVATPSTALSKEDFLAEPWRHFCSGSVTWDFAWLPEAYRQPHFRHQFMGSVARDLSKVGSLDGYQHLLAVIAPTLSIADAVEFFLLLRGARDENEWRSQFESLFPAAKAQLPPTQHAPLVSADDWSDDLPK